MSDNNGWPGKPGVPMNPERDGWHWVNSTPREWVVDDDAGWWRCGMAGSDYRPPARIAHRMYQGPCLTPTEVDASIAKASKDALEKCILICDAVARANRVEYPEKWKDRPEGSPHEWHRAWDEMQRSWETCAETAEDIAAEIRALAKGEGHD